ncbi:MAG: hypothetical protein P0S95_02395 [Rhabdochlamydiaceae bacterium]|nr:hypothetical protein [Candidatus Amphrikana amoebophyrae]
MASPSIPSLTPVTIESLTEELWPHRKYLGIKEAKRRGGISLMSEEMQNEMIKRLKLEPGIVTESFRKKAKDNTFAWDVRFLGNLLNFHYSPTNLGMQILARHYSNVCNRPIFAKPADEMLATIATARKTHNMFGLILYTAEHGHVTPVLCFKDKTQKLFILVMDCISSVDHCHPVSLPLTQKPPENCEILFSEGLRQASHYGCRSEAFATMEASIKFFQRPRSILTKVIEGGFETFTIPSPCCPAAEIITHLDMRLDKTVEINQYGQTAEKLRNMYTSKYMRLIEGGFVVENQPYTSLEIVSRRTYLRQREREDMEIILNSPECKAPGLVKKTALLV